MRRNALGISLVEVLVTLSLGAVLTSAAVPVFRNYVADTRLSATTNVFLSHLSAARSDAITRGVPVAVCASKDGAVCGDAADWRTGWITFTDADGDPGKLDGNDELLRVAEPHGRDLALESESSYVRYDPMGMLQPR